MNNRMTSRGRLWRRRDESRRGAVAVEFAVIVPVLLAITLGMVELTRAIDSQTMLETAAREGARFAAMDRSDMEMNGLSSNQKLESNGIDSADVSVEVKDHTNPATDFDLDDPANELELFEVHVSIDYSDVSFMPVGEGQDYTLLAKVVFRNGIATISQ